MAHYAILGSSRYMVPWVGQLAISYDSGMAIHSHCQPWGDQIWSAYDLDQPMTLWPVDDGVLFI